MSFQLNQSDLKITNSDNTSINQFVNQINILNSHSDLLNNNKTIIGLMYEIDNNLFTASKYHYIY